MKTIKITEEQHDQLRTYSFFNKITIQQLVSNAITEYVEKCNSSKVVNTTSSKVESTTNLPDDLDFTDREAQKLIDNTILEKFNLS